MEKRRNKLELITQNAEFIVNSIIFIVLMVTVFLFLNKNKVESYKVFPFNMDNLYKFHELVEKKIIPRFEFKLKMDLKHLNLRDVCERDYEITENCTLRFTYLGEVILVQNLQKNEIIIENLKKISDFDSLICKIIIFIALVETKNTKPKKPSFC